MSNQGHWVGLTADTKNYFGFIYLISDLTTGRKYIGKKQFYFAKRGAKKCRSKVADRQSAKWKGSCWVDSGWREYKGSSPSLTKWMKDNPDNQYTFEIIKLCRSRGVLTYSEVAEMWDRRVLETQMDDGEYLYFNRHIGAIKFRPQLFQTKESNKKRSESHKKIVKSEKWVRNAAAGKVGVKATEEAKKNLAISHGKLDEEDVLQILLLLDEGGFKKTEIAKMFCISNTTVGNIDSGRTWKHLTKTRRKI